ncbi:uncharacterized protein LOC128557321 [Mercenaria mercenaria]|uniref:uncharacterized protein LOC128557321 n=1 Tax=Mercenaria mercenaria TaxID=6596 RepID=UPI00234E7C6A|nr:uncharacterized protein LOC128557321 [Mercenaria mercenaria]
MDCGDMYEDNWVPAGRQSVVFGTPSGEVTWRRRSGEERVSEDQGFIHPGKSCIISSGEARAPGVRNKALQGGIDMVLGGRGEYRDFCTNANYRGSVPLIADRTLADGIIDQCQVPGGYTGRGWEQREKFHSDEQSEAGLLDEPLTGYQGVRSRVTVGASTERLLGPRDTRVDADFNAFLPRNRDVGRPLSSNMPLEPLQYPVQTPIMTSMTTKPSSNIKPPTYDGTSDLSSYLTQFEMTSDLNNWTRDKKALQLAVSLRGNATEILNDIPLHRRRDYDHIVSHLVERFQPQNQRKLHVAKLRARIRKRNESLDDLANDIKKLVRLAYPDLDMNCREEMALEAFAEALNDDQLRRDLIVGGPKTMSEALRLAVESELNYTRRSSYSRMVQNEPLDGILRRVDELERRSETQMYQRIAQIENEQGKNETRNNRSDNPGSRIPPRKPRSGVCHRCGLPGHYRSNCPQLKDPRNLPYNKFHNPQYRGTQEYRNQYQNKSSRDTRPQNQGNGY